jgi:hypothetical protein
LDLEETQSDGEFFDGERHSVTIEGFWVPSFRHLLGSFGTFAELDVTRSSCKEKAPHPEDLDEGLSRCPFELGA